MKTHVYIHPELGPCTNPDMEWPEVTGNSNGERVEFENYKSRWLSGATVPFEDEEVNDLIINEQLTSSPISKSQKKFFSVKPLFMVQGKRDDQLTDLELRSKTAWIDFREKILTPGAVLSLDLPEWVVVGIFPPDGKNRRVIRFKPTNP